MPVRRPGLCLSDIKPAPIPPSLVSSPFLTSPIFKYEGSPPYLPTEQDEFWLQDTVPLTPSPPDHKKHVHYQLEPRRPAPQSPPIVINQFTRSPHLRANSHNNLPTNHPSNCHYHRSLSHARSMTFAQSSLSGPQQLGFHPTPSSGDMPMRMRSDSDLALLAKEQATSGASSAGKNLSLR